MQIKIQIAEILELALSPSEINTFTENLKRYKSSSNDKNTSEFIKTGDESLLCEIRRVTNFVWNEEYLPQQWKYSNSVPIYKKENKLTVVVIETCHS